jgi:hypothetical protein
MAPPVSDESRLPPTGEANGNVTPLLGPNGGVNALAWQHYQSGSVGSKPIRTSQTLALGRSASTHQVLQAMCADYSNVYGTIPLTVSAEHLAAAYYGWDFGGSDPAVKFQRSGCLAASPTTTLPPSSPPAASSPTSAASSAAVTSTWTTFFNGATPVAEKASLLQGGSAATTDIGLFFALFQATLSTKVDALQLHGVTADVTYEFQTGTNKLSAQPMTGTAVLVDGKWLVSQTTWSAWVSKLDIHGSA